MVREFAITISGPSGFNDDSVFNFIVATDCSLYHVSGCCIANDTTLKIGTTLDDEAHLAEATLTAGTVREFELGDFVPTSTIDGSDLYPDLSKGDQIVVTIDGATAPEDVMIVLTFTEG